MSDPYYTPEELEQFEAETEAINRKLADGELNFKAVEHGTYVNRHPAGDATA
jgi:hypothetical protein